MIPRTVKQSLQWGSLLLVFTVTACRSISSAPSDSPGIPPSLVAVPTASPLPTIVPTTVPSKVPTTLPELARYALEHYFATGEVAALPHIPPAWQGSQGVFVTLSLRGQMRGCWGSLTPTAPTLAEGTIRAAIGAATRDPRFPPLRRSELPHVRIQVALIRDAQPVEHLAALDPTRTGLWIRHGTQGAVLLPGEALTTQWQLARAKALAGIPPTATVELFRVDADLLREL